MLEIPIRETYLDDSEYRGYYGSLGSMRNRIAADLPVLSEGHVLDLATGYGYFAIEIARCWPSVRVTGIDISNDGVAKATEEVNAAMVEDQVEILRMDSCHMTFPDEHFDMVVNFTGLEDIHMTRGREGVELTLKEMARVLKPSSFACLAVMPPDAMETRAQQLEVEVFSAICGATWLNTDEYIDLLTAAGLELVSVRQYYTGKKLTPWQASQEIRFACEETRKIYRIPTMSFERTWKQFGREIEEHGMGHMSKVLTLLVQKRPLDEPDTIE